MTRLAELERARPAAVVVCSGKANGFVAGADIKEFTGLTTPEQAYELIHAGQRVFDRLAALPCPTVAAINGFALGGGLELALACRYRVASNDGRVSLGLPEVQLGIHPGFRRHGARVQLIGVRAAMELMLTGRPVKADEGYRLGLVDQLVPAADLRARAKALALAAPSPRSAGLARCAAQSRAGTPPARQAAAQASEQRRARRDHYPAPYAIIELWERYGAHGAQAYEAEARSIAALMLTPTARNLVRVFLLQDRLKSLGGKADTGVQARTCRRRRRHGRRYRRLVRLARHERDAAGPRGGIRAARARAGTRILRQEAALMRAQQRPRPRACRWISQATAPRAPTS